MTENVLSNIFESLSLGDKTAAETQLDEWFKKAASTADQPDDEYDVEDSDEEEKFNVRNRRTGRVVGMGMGRDYADNYAKYHGKLGPMEEGAQHEVVATDDENVFNVRDKRNGKIVGMGMDRQSADNYAKTHKNLPPIGEDAGDAGPHDTAPWSRAIQEFIAAQHPDDDSARAIEIAQEALTRLGNGFPDQALKKLRELDEYFYEQLMDLLPEEYRNYADSVSQGSITAIPEQDSINTTRRCGECGEIDAAMEEKAEFCDQCIQEANAANPDLVGNDEPNVMIPVKDIKWTPSNESIDPDLAALMEEFKGFTVVDKLANKEGALVGNADSIQVNDKSPVPNIKAAKRVGGAPVEIKAEEHKGFDAEKAPAVKDAKVKNPAPKSERKEVADGGSKSALLNKEEGKGNNTSPLGSKSRD